MSGSRVRNARKRKRSRKGSALFYYAFKPHCIRRNLPMQCAFPSGKYDFQTIFSYSAAAFTASRSRIFAREIFPDAERGRSSTNSMILGYL